MKFSEVIMATASLVLLGFLLDFILKGAFTLFSSIGIELLAWIVAVLVASSVVGYVFANRIREESRTKAIGGVAVLSTFTLMLFLMVWIANPIASPWVKESLESLFNTSEWTSFDWSAYLAISLALEVVAALASSFIGLYVGSMLRKPKKG